MRNIFNKNNKRKQSAYCRCGKETNRAELAARNCRTCSEQQIIHDYVNYNQYVGVDNRFQNNHPVFAFDYNTFPSVNFVG